MRKKPKKKKYTSKFLTISIALVLVGITIFYFYSADQAKIRGFAFGNDIQSLQKEVENEQGQFISSIAKWDENAISNDEMIRIGEKHLETFNKLLNILRCSSPILIISSLEIVFSSHFAILEINRPCSFCTSSCSD